MKGFMAFLVGIALWWKYRWVSAAGTRGEKKRREEKKASRTSSYLVELGVFKMTHPEKLIGYSV